MRLWNTQTEQEEHVAAAQAESALRATNPDGSPLYLPSVAARYPVQLSDGRLGTVLGTELLPVLQDGGRLSDWLSLDREKRRAKAEGLLPTLRTMGRAALSGLTLGLGVETDPERLEAEALAAEQQGDITTGERLRQRAAEHRASPVLGGVAEVGGMMAPALATGGGSLLGTALRVTPTGLALRAGQAAGRAVLGEGATAAARIGAGAVAGGVEAGIWGVATAARDPQADAEALLYGGLAGAALGAGVGAALPAGGAGLRAGGRLLRQVRPADIEEVAAKAFGRAASGVGELVLGAQRLATGITAEEQAVFGKAWKPVRDKLRQAPQIRNQIARDFTEDITEIVKARVPMMEEMKGAAKTEAVDQAFHRESALAAIGAAASLRHQTMDVLGESSERLAQYRDTADAARSLGRWRTVMDDLPRPGADPIADHLHWSSTVQRLQEEVHALAEGLAVGATRGGVGVASEAGLMQRLLAQVDDLADAIQPDIPGGAKFSGAQLPRLPQIEQEARAVVAEMRKELQTTLRFAKVEMGGFAKPLIKRLETALQQLSWTAQRPVRGTTLDVTRYFVKLDRIKKALGLLRNSLAGPESGAGGLSRTEVLEARETTERLFSRVRGVLERDDLWGREAAGMQRAINAPWHDGIDAEQVFLPTWTVKTFASENNVWVREVEADPAKVAAHLAGLTRPENDLSIRALTKFLNAYDLLSEEMVRRLGWNAKAVEAAKRIKPRIARIRQNLLDQQELLAQLAQAEALTTASQNAPAIAASLIGYAVGGPIGAALGAAVTNPAALLRSQAAAQRALDSARAPAAAAARSVRKGAAAAAKAT